jgi:hypothetical protein
MNTDHEDTNNFPAGLFAAICSVALAASAFYWGIYKPSAALALGARGAVGAVCTSTPGCVASYIGSDPSAKGWRSGWLVSFELDATASKETDRLLRATVAQYIRDPSAVTVKVDRAGVAKSQRAGAGR